MISLTNKQKREIEESIRQRDAISALEGFQPTEQTRRIDEAVLAGKISRQQVISEMVEYAKQHKTTIGFIESRQWN